MGREALIHSVSGSCHPQKLWQRYSDSTVNKAFARRSDGGSLERACSASVGHLAHHQQLELSVLHGDDTHTGAKKGSDGIGYSGHKPQKGENMMTTILDVG